MDPRYSQMMLPSSVKGGWPGLGSGVSEGSSSVPGSTTLFLNVNNVAPGIYPLTVSGSDGDEDFAVTVQMSVSAEVPDTPLLSAPIDGSPAVSAFQTLFWEPSPGAFAYDVEIATDANIETTSPTHCGSSGSKQLAPRISRVKT